MCSNSPNGRAAKTARKETWYAACEPRLYTVELQKLYEKRHGMRHLSHLYVFRRMMDIAAAPRTQDAQSLTRYFQVHAPLQQLVTANSMSGSVNKV